MTTTTPPPAITLAYLTVDDVKTYLRIADGLDDEVLTDAVNAAMALQYARCPTALAGMADDPAADPLVVTAVPADLALAAQMRASRLYARRASPEGLLPLGDLGVARIPAYDRDIDALEAPYRDVVLA